MSMQALAGLSNFVDQLNSKLAEIPRVITVAVPSVAAPTSGVTSQSSQGSMDANALAEHLYPRIRDLIDQDARLRSVR